MAVQGEFSISVRADATKLAADLNAIAASIAGWAANVGKAVKTGMVTPMMAVQAGMKGMADTANTAGSRSQHALTGIALAMRKLEIQADRTKSHMQRFLLLVQKDLLNVSNIFVRRFVFSIATTLERFIFAIARAPFEFFRQVIDVGKEFEDAMIRTAAVVSGAETEEITPAFQRMSQIALDLADNSVFMASEIAGAMFELASVGIVEAEMFDTIAAAASFAAATQTDLMTATNLLTQIMKAFNLTGADMGDVSDMLVLAFDTTSVNVERLTAAMKFAAPTAGSLGISLAETINVVSRFIDVTKQGGISGRAFRFMMQAIIDPSAKAVTEIGRLGFTVQDLDPRFGRLIKTMDSLVMSFFDATSSAIIFGNRAGPTVAGTIDDLRIGLAAGRDELQLFKDKLTDAQGYDLATDQAKIFRSALTQEFLLLRSRTERLLIEVFTKIAPVIKVAVHAAQDAVSGLTVVVAAFTDNLGKMAYSLTILAIPALFSLASAMATVSTGVVGLGGGIASVTFSLRALRAASSRTGKSMISLAAAVGVMRGIPALGAAIAGVGAVLALVFSMKESVAVRDGLDRIANGFSWLGTVLFGFGPILVEFVSNWGITWDSILEFSHTWFDRMTLTIGKGFQKMIAKLARWSGELADMIRVSQGSSSVFDTLIAATQGLSNKLNAYSIAIGMSNEKLEKNIELGIQQRATLKLLTAELDEADKAYRDLTAALSMGIDSAESFEKVQAGVIKAWGLMEEKGKSMKEKLQLLQVPLQKLATALMLNGEQFDELANPEVLKWIEELAQYLRQAGEAAEETEEKVSRSFEEMFFSARDSLGVLTSLDIAKQFRQLESDMIHGLGGLDRVVDRAQVYEGFILKLKEMMIVAGNLLGPNDPQTLALRKRFEDFIEWVLTMPEGAEIDWDKVKGFGDDIEPVLERTQSLFAEFYAEISKGFARAIGEMIFEAQSFGEFLEDLFKGLVKKGVLDVFAGFGAAVSDLMGEGGTAVEDMKGFAGTVGKFFQDGLGKNGTATRALIGLGALTAGIAAGMQRDMLASIASIVAAAAAGFATGGWVGAAIGAVAALVGNLIGSAANKEREEAIDLEERLIDGYIRGWAMLGAISKNTAAAIMALTNELREAGRYGAFFVARWMSLGTVIAETGVNAENFADILAEIAKGFVLLAKGTITEKEFVDELNEVIPLLVENTEWWTAANVVAFRTLVDLLRMSGIEIEALTEYISGALDTAADAINRLAESFFLTGTIFENSQKNLNKFVPILDEIWKLGDKAKGVAEKLAAALKMGGKEGAKAMREALRELRKMGSEGAALAEQFLALYTDISTDFTEISAGNLKFLSTQFNAVVAEMLANGASIADIIAVFAPLFEKANAAGVKLGGTFGWIQDIAEKIMDDKHLQKITDRQSAMVDLFKALRDIGLVTQTTMRDFARQLGRDINKMIKRGLSMNEALAMSGPMLIQLRDAAALYGLKLSANTRAYIEQAEAAGLIGPRMKSIQEITAEGFNLLLQAINALIVALGGIPIAFDDIETHVRDTGDVLDEVWEGSAKRAATAWENNAERFVASLDFTARAVEGLAMFTRDEFRSMAEAMGLSAEDQKQFVKDMMKAQRIEYRETARIAKRLEKDKAKAARKAARATKNIWKDILKAIRELLRVTRDRGVETFEDIADEAEDSAARTIKAWDEWAKVAYKSSIFPDTEMHGVGAFFAIAEASARGSKRAITDWQEAFKTFYEGFQETKMSASTVFGAIGDFAGSTFSALVDGFRKVGLTGGTQLRELIEEARNLGMQIQEITAYVEGEVSDIFSGLAEILEGAVRDIEVILADGTTETVKVFDLSMEDALFAFDAMTTAILELQAEGWSLTEIFAKYGDTMLGLKDIVSEVFGSGAASLIGEFFGVFDALSDPEALGIAQRINGLEKVARGMANLGKMSQGSFSNFGASIKANFNKLLNFMGRDDALRLIGGSLGTLDRLAGEFGLTIPRELAALLQEALGKGFVTDVRPPEEIMADALAELTLVIEQLIEVMRGNFTPGTGGGGGGDGEVPDWFNPDGNDGDGGRKKGGGNDVVLPPEDTMRNRRSKNESQTRVYIGTKEIKSFVTEIVQEAAQNGTIRVHPDSIYDAPR